jgi:YtcA family
MSFRHRRGVPGAWLFVVVVASGCDPTLNLWGSMFPAWVICLLIAVTLAVLVRWGLAAAGLERHLGPLVLVYPSLVVLLSCLTWAVLFRG